MRSLHLASGLLAYTLWLAAAPASADTIVQLVPPTVLTRTTEKPASTTLTFPALPGEILVTITTEGSKIPADCTSALVAVNGRTIATPDEFKNTGTTLRKTCTAEVLNDLTIQLRAKPGSSITVLVEQTISADAGAPVGPTGGTLALSAAGHPLDGLVVSVPEGALSAPVLLTATYVANTETAQPVVLLEPRGTEFDKPITITMPFVIEGDVPGFFTSTMAIYSRPSLESAPERLPLVAIDIEDQRATATTTHFSYVSVNGDRLYRQGGLDAAVDEGATAVLLVHGFNAPWGRRGDCRNTFDELPALLAERTYDVYLLDYRTGQAIRESAISLNLALDSVRLYAYGSVDAEEPVALICHSMGGLVARAYLQGLEDDYEDDVDVLITLGTPHNGSSKAETYDAAWHDSVDDMVPGSAFLSDLNSTYDLPKGVRYTVVFGELNGTDAPDGDDVVLRSEAQLSRALDAKGSPRQGYDVAHVELALGHDALAKIENTGHAAWPVILDALNGSVWGTASHIKLFRNRRPWDSSAVEQILASLGFQPGSGEQQYEVLTSGLFATASLRPGMDLVLIANDQDQRFYNDLAAASGRLTQFLERGGAVFWGGCDRGWGGGSMSSAGLTLPGGVQYRAAYYSYNYVVDSDSPLTVGLPTTLYGTHASHEGFRSLPALAATYVVDVGGLATLLEYPVGRGRVLLTGQPLEYHYRHGQPPGPILPRALRYALGIPAPVAMATSRAVEPAQAPVEGTISSTGAPEE